MDVFGLVLTVAALVGVAILILLFERKRATGIERDLREMAGRDEEQPRQDGPAPGAEGC